jgi:hypothetical protein
VSVSRWPKRQTLCVRGLGPQPHPGPGDRIIRRVQTQVAFVLCFVIFVLLYLQTLNQLGHDSFKQKPSHNSFQLRLVWFTGFLVCPILLFCYLLWPFPCYSQYYHMYYYVVHGEYYVIVVDILLKRIVSAATVVINKAAKLLLPSCCC